jgi:hypothetical protein
MGIVVAGKSFATLRAAQGKGDQSSMVQSGVSCSRMDCSERVVTSLGPEDLCFDHFCIRCYELLANADRRMMSPHGAAALTEVMCTLDECARRALEISLSEIELNNFDRARLLDIVLWSGDLTSLLRRKRGGSASKIQSEEGRGDVLQHAIRNSRVN